MFSAMMKETGAETVPSAPAARAANIKICQTDQLVLVSILEPGLIESEVSVLIDPKHLSVMIARQYLENPVIYGKLFGAIEKQHCRIRVKPDHVLIKLRKKTKGRWKSILRETDSDEKEDDTELQESVEALEDEVEKMTCDDSEQAKEKSHPQDPIAPAEQRAADMVNIGQARVSFNPMDKTTTTSNSEKLVKGVMDKIKQFQQDLFAGKPATKNRSRTESCRSCITDGPCATKVDDCNDTVNDEATDENESDSDDDYNPFAGTKSLSAAKTNNQKASAID